MIVFQGNRGAVVLLPDPTAQAAVGFVNVAPPTGNNLAATSVMINYQTRRSIITRLTVSQRTNVQFLHTIGAFIYIYVFGDRIGQIGISGLSFAAPCDGGVHGVAQMLAWYSQFRVSALGAPLRVSIATTTIEGFVTDASYDVVDPESGLVQWNVTMQTLPELVPSQNGQTNQPVTPPTPQPTPTPGPPLTRGTPVPTQPPGRIIIPPPIVTGPIVFPPEPPGHIFIPPSGPVVSENPPLLRKKDFVTPGFTVSGTPLVQNAPFSALPVIP